MYRIRRNRQTIKVQVDLQPIDSDIQEPPFADPVFSSGALGRNVLATRKLTFPIKPVRFEGITGHSTSRPGYEGNGYSMGLALLSNEMIRDVFRRYPEIYKGQEFLSAITDVAEGQPVDNTIPKIRQKWSSRIAQMLGYEQHPLYSTEWSKKFGGK